MSVVLTPVVQSSDLVSLGRATQNAVLSALNTSNPTLAASLISAASDLIRQVTHRDFNLTDYSIYVDGVGNGVQVLILPQYPITAISRISADPQTVLTVTNTDTTTNQRAVVSTAATGMTLLRVASGVATTSSLLYSNSPTLTALAAAIAALGHGWAATVATPYGLYPSVDLRYIQGAVNALAPSGGASLEMCLEDIQPFRDGYWTGGYGWRLDDASGQVFAALPGGKRNVRVDYSAGYASIPAAVQEATVAAAQWLYESELASSVAQSETLGPQSISYLAKRGLPGGIMALLSSYVDHAALLIN